MANDQGEQQEPQAPQGQQGQSGSEGAQGAQGQQGNPEPEGEGVKDSHGQPGINRDKYRRDMQARDEEIAKLKEQIAEAAKTEAGREELQKKIDALEADIADERLTHKLEMASCRNVKAAKALIGDYENDVAKLKEACPYLFDDAKGSTGLKPEGAASGKTKIEKKIDEVFARN